MRPIPDPKSVALILTPSLAAEPGFRSDPTIARYYPCLMDGLRRAGVEPVLIVPLGRRRAPGWLSGTPFTAVSPPKNVREATAWGRRLAAMMARRGVKAVHWFGVREDVDVRAALNAADAGGLPFLTTLQGFPWHVWRGSPRGKPPASLARFYERAAAITLLSDRQRKVLLERFPRLDPRRLRVIDNGADPRFFRPDPHSRRALADGRRPSVLCTARLAGHKGIDLLLLAFHDLLTGGTEAELVISGPDESGGRFHTLAEKLGISGQVRFTGLVAHDKLHELLRNCSCFVLPSRSETFGIAALEAMACGKPVILSKGAGLAERVRAGEALLVDARDPKSLARALRRVLSSAALRRRLGARARRLASSRSWTQVALKYAELYAEISYTIAS